MKPLDTAATDCRIKELVESTTHMHQDEAGVIDMDAVLNDLAGQVLDARTLRSEIAEPTDRELALQAKIDALMLEYCPDEMTKPQIEEWMLAQVAAPLSANSLTEGDLATQRAISDKIAPITGEITGNRAKRGLAAMSDTPRVDEWERTAAPYADLINLAKDLERAVRPEAVATREEPSMLGPECVLGPLPDVAHTDHPLRHFDRTCPACVEGARTDVHTISASTPASSAAKGPAQLVEVLDDIEDYLEQHQDVMDGNDGPRPNEAMSLLSRIAEARTQWARAALSAIGEQERDAKRWAFCMKNGFPKHCFNPEKQVHYFYIRADVCPEDSCYGWITPELAVDGTMRSMDSRSEG